MDIRIENVVKLMRKRLSLAKKSKFRKFLKLIAARIGRDSSMNRRTNRLWREIISKRHYFNLKSRVQDVISGLKFDNLIGFFDKIFEYKLKKLSIQEFSSKIKKLPVNVGRLRGFKGKLINDRNFYRFRNKFI